jgi:ribosomal protein L29
MAKHKLTTGELRKMQRSDLQKEVDERRAQIAKTRLDIDLQKEKDTAKHRKAKRELARILTVLNATPPTSRP